MESRIRVGVLIFKDDKLLLVRHVNPKTGYIWWVPPGGGLQGSETIFECAEREVREETGLKVTAQRPVYLRQFIYTEFSQNNVDLYVLGELIGGLETMENLKGLGGDEHFIKELKYFSEKDITTMNVFPEVLKKDVWKDRSAGFQVMRFLGVEDDRH